MVVATYFTVLLFPVHSFFFLLVIRGVPSLIFVQTQVLAPLNSRPVDPSALTVRVFLHVFFCFENLYIIYNGEVYTMACGIMMYKLHVLHDMRIMCIFIYL